MKNIPIYIMLLCSITVFAQRPAHGKMDKQNESNEKMKSFSPEQQAELESKRLTLALDLNETQQQAVKTLALEKASKRKTQHVDKAARKKLTSEERYQLQATRLDDQIAYKSRMKSILNKDQYASWEKLQMKRRQRGGKKRQMKKDGEKRKKS